MRSQDCERRLANGAIRQSEYSPQPEAPQEYTKDMYKPLQDGRRSIRLLKLLSSSPQSPQIECELVVYGYESATNSIGRDYEALSWCWGDQAATAHINIRQGDGIYAKYVSPNLVAALHALRHNQKNRYLWIDAVCINQDDLQEKNHQVEMMSTIYGQAKMVCIWLGEGDRSSRMALRFIREEVLTLQNFDELCESEEASKKWSALLDLMQRPWFFRRWVVQEIALAREAMIYCGSDKIPWKSFAVAVELFVEVETATHRLSEVMKKDPKFYHVPGWFEYVSALGASLLVEATGKLLRDYKDSPFPNSGPSRANDNRDRRQPLLNIEYLVSSLSIFEVSVEHDTIYALLAIAKDTTPSAGDSESGPHLDRTQTALEVFTQRKRYTVAYEQPYVEVCKEFVKFCIQQSDPTRAIDIICRPWAPKDNQNTKRLRNPDRALISRKDDLPLPSWVPQLSGAPYAMYHQAGVHTLKMGRKNADTLVGLPSSLQRNYNAAESRGVDGKVLRFRKRTMNGDNMHYSMFVKGFVLDTVAEVLPASQGGAIPQEWTDAAGWQDAPNTEPPDEFWRTIVADRGRDGRNPPVYYSRACKESFSKGGLVSGSMSTSDLINNERCSVIAQFCRRVQAVVWNRSLIKTASGKLGLVSRNVKRGDCVCILYGCSVPVILRKSNRKNDDEVMQEKKEDILHSIAEVQRRWRLRYQHLKRRRAKRLKRQAQTGKRDETFTKLKWGRRWKKIVRAKRKARGTGSRIATHEEIAHQNDLQSHRAQENGLHESRLQINGTGSGSASGTGIQVDPDKAKAAQNAPSAEAVDWQQILNRTPSDPASFYHFEFLGEAYIHSMMDGEAIAYQNSEGIKAEVFELR